MLENAFWILIGAFVGWNIPQPAWAAGIQDRYINPVVAWVKDKIPFI